MTLIYFVSYLSPHRLSYTELLGFHERTKICPTFSLPPCCSLGLGPLFSLQSGPVPHQPQCERLLLIIYLYALYVCPTDVGDKGPTLVVFLSCLLLYLFLRQVFH